MHTVMHTEWHTSKDTKPLKLLALSMYHKMVWGEGVFLLQTADYSATKGWVKQLYTKTLRVFLNWVPKSFLKEFIQAIT